MTRFIRLLDVENKAEAMAEAVTAVREGYAHPRVFKVNPESFAQVPGSPFAYWVSDKVLGLFNKFPKFEGEGRTVKIGMKTGDDFRFLRLWWEEDFKNNDFFCYAKGGTVQSYYGDLKILVNWKNDGKEVKKFVSQRMKKMFGNEKYEFWISNEKYYFNPGITWSLRGSKFSPRVLPSKSIFSVRGYSALVSQDEEFSSLALMNSTPFDYIFKTTLGRFSYPEFIVGTLQKLPWVAPDLDHSQRLAKLARRAWSTQRQLDTTNETSHAFVLPALLRTQRGDWNPAALKAELRQIQTEIDAIAFDLYGFSPADREAVARLNNVAPEAENPEEEEEAA